MNHTHDEECPRCGHLFAAQPATRAEVPLHDCGTCVPAGLSAARCESCPHIQAEASAPQVVERGLGPLWPNGDRGRGDLPPDDDGYAPTQASAPSVQVVEPAPMNDVQLLAGSQILAEAIDDEFLKRGDWRPLAIGFAKSAMTIRDAMWRHAIAQASAPPAAQQPPPIAGQRITEALEHQGCARLREWAATGPVQRAALELFADLIAQQPAADYDDTHAAPGHPNSEAQPAVEPVAWLKEWWSAGSYLSRVDQHDRLDAWMPRSTKVTPLGPLASPTAQPAAQQPAVEPVDLHPCFTEEG